MNVALDRTTDLRQSHLCVNHPASSHRQYPMRKQLVIALFSVFLLPVCGSNQPRGNSHATGDFAGEEGLDYDPDKLVRFELVASTDVLKPDETATLGALFHIAEGWHIYWINPGDSGLATRITLDAVTGVALGQPQFPGPVRFDSEGDIHNYGYHGTLLVPISMAATNNDSGTVQVRAKATWLACREDACVPGDGQASLSLPASVTDRERAARSAQIQAALAQVPRPVSAYPADADSSFEVSLADGKARVRVRGPKDASLDVFPVIDAAISEVERTGDDKSQALHFTLSPQGDTVQLAVLSVRIGSETTFFSITSEQFANQ